jgi:hypothetical protein
MHCASTATWTAMMSTAAVVRVAVRCLCLCPWEGRANAPFAYFYVDTSPSGHSPVSARPRRPRPLDTTSSTTSSSSTTTTTTTTPECVCPLYLTPCRPCHASPALPRRPPAPLAWIVRPASRVAFHMPAVCLARFGRFRRGSPSSALDGHIVDSPATADRDAAHAASTMHTCTRSLCL